MRVTLMSINKLGVLKYGDEKEPLAMEMCCHLTTIACINLEAIGYTKKRACGTRFTFRCWLI